MALHLHVWIINVQELVIAIFVLYYKFSGFDQFILV